MTYNAQQVFDNASNFLRTHGNPYGGIYSRGWDYVNPRNSGERCAIASFIAGNTNDEIIDNIYEQVIDDSANFVVNEIIALFDHNVPDCNDDIKLEAALQRIADKHGLTYTNPIKLNIQAYEISN